MITTEAADRFVDGISVSWDNRDCYEATAEKGLSETDEDSLRALCDETDEDYKTAEAEVLAFVRSHLARTAEVS